MTNLRVLYPLTFLALAGLLLLAACDPSRGAPEGVTCPDLELRTSSAQPLDTVRVEGLPGALGDSLFVAVTVPEADSLYDVGTFAVARVIDLDDRRRAFQVPIHPSGTREGGAVLLRFSDGHAACPAERFEVEALPAAPGAASRMVDHLDDLLRVQTAFFGITLEELREANPAEAFEVLIPLRAAQYLIDHPRNPNSLRAMMEGTADQLQPTEEERALLDALWSKAELPRHMEQHVQALQSRAPLSFQESSGASSVLGSSMENPSPTESPFRLASHAPSAPTAVERNVVPDAIAEPSPEMLHQMMTQALDSDIKTSGRAEKIWSLLETTLEVSSAGFTLTPGGQPLGGLFGAEAAYANAHSFVHEGLAGLLPRHLTDMTFGFDPADFEEDRPGPGLLYEVNLFAMSQGWSFDAMIVEKMLSKVGLSKNVVDGPAQDFLELVSNQVDAAIAEATAGDSRRAEIGPKRFGPTDLMSGGDWRPWLDINIIGDAVRAIGGPPDAYRYDPVQVGEATLRVATKWDRFGIGDGQHISAERPLRVRAMGVVIDPPSQLADPGEVVTLEAGVLDALDSRLDWTVESGQGQITAIHPIGSNRYEVDVAVPDPFETPIVVKATSLADRSHLNVQPERSATARLRPKRLAIAPTPACVAAGEAKRFDVPGMNNRDVLWSANAGTISEDGVLQVPQMSGTVFVRAVSKEDPALEAEISFDVEETCGATCTFTAEANYPDGVYSYSGKAKVQDAGEKRYIALYADDASWRYFVDLSSVEIGQSGSFTTQGGGTTSFLQHRISLQIDENADPGGIAEWPELTIREQLESGLGLPERMAMRRVKGEFTATFVGSGSGASRVVAEFDAGNGPYHCEGGLQKQQEAIEQLQDMFRDNN